MLQGTAELLNLLACQSRRSCHVSALNSINRNAQRPSYLALPCTTALITANHIEASLAIVCTATSPGIVQNITAP